jgi:hypothetical protein
MYILYQAYICTHVPSCTRTRTQVGQKAYHELVDLHAAFLEKCVMNCTIEVARGGVHPSLS